MIRNCITAALLALVATSIGCRSCDECYDEGPIVGGCPDCGPNGRSGSVSGAYPGPVYQGAPVYTQPGMVQPAPSPAPAPARPR
jgi:hypothetical protein